MAENKHQMEISLNKNIKKEVKDLQATMLKDVHNMIAKKTKISILSLVYVMINLAQRKLRF